VVAELTPLFRSRTVLALGDVMLDRYVSGEVSRISPKALIPVLRVTGSRASSGGAANVAHNIAALGARQSFSASSVLMARVPARSRCVPSTLVGCPKV
jgi:bifunctional ADP-heptose synthase (sugar kinase/adenylyltransferase)